MIPILFEYNTTDFSTHGIGDLLDCTSCSTLMNEEGEYELSFNYPKTGDLLKELTIGRLVYAKANPWQSPQIFRIYGYKKGIGGIVTVNCQHISYDLANIPVKNFKSAASASCNTVLANLKSNAIAISGLNINKFSFYSNVTGTAQTQTGYFELGSPSTARAAILDGEESIKGCFGGDLVFDNYNVYIYATGGSDRGVTIEYGVDLMDFRQEENISEMYTGVLPYYTYTDVNDNDQITYGSVQYASGTFRSHKVLPMSFNEYFPDQAEHTSPTAAQLNAKAAEWISKEPEFGKPEVNLTLKYAELGQDVRLHDAVAVNFVQMDIEPVKSKVVSVKYDVLLERITEIQIGQTKSSVIFSLEDASRLRRGLLPPARIKDKSLTSSKYADNSVTTAALGSEAVTTDKLNDAAVTNSKLGSRSVGSNNIQDQAVVTRSIADYAVKEGQIGGGAVTESKVASKAVTSDKVADNAVTERTVKDLAITVNKIGDGAIITQKLSDGAVVSDKITNGSILTAKLIDKAVTYAKSSYQGTLDQVDINASDIAVIQALFIGHGEAQSFNVSGNLSAGSMVVNGQISASSVSATNVYSDGGIVATQTWVSSNFKPK